MNKLATERDLRQEWETPQDFFDVVDAEFGFTLDAAATFENRKCDKYISQETDALIGSWEVYPPRERAVWLNPGFSDLDVWVEKAYHESLEDWVSLVVVMSLISPSTKWWRDWATKASEIRLLGGRRVQFVAPEGVKQSSNARENCLIIFRPNPHNLPPRIWTWDWTGGL